MGNLSVPIIDISGLFANNANEVDRQISKACEEWGFFYAVNHGVDLKLIQRTIDLGLEFFHLPKDFKNTVARSEVSILNSTVNETPILQNSNLNILQWNLQGYSDSELTKQKLDWKEVFDFTPDVPVTDDIVSSWKKSMANGAAGI